MEKHLFVISALFLVVQLTAFPWRHEKGWRVDVPETWKTSSNELPVLVGFSDAEGLTQVQVYTFPPGHFENARALEKYFTTRLKFEGETASVLWDAWTCGLASGSTALSSVPFSVLAGFWHHPTKGAVALWGQVPGRYANEMEPFLLSILDSLAPEWSLVNQPGLASRVLDGVPSGNNPMTIPFGGELFRVDFHPTALESARRVAARERKLLLSYSASETETQYGAMARFYRMVYRNAYPGFETLAGSLESYFVRKAMDQRQRVGFLTAAVYLCDDRIYRDDTLETPFDLLLRQSGDCDSKTLLLSLLLERAKLSSAFLLSLEDHHAFIGLSPQDLVGTQAPFLEGLRGEPLVGIDLVHHPVTNIYSKERWRALPVRMEE